MVQRHVLMEPHDRGDDFGIDSGQKPYLRFLVGLSPIDHTLQVRHVTQGSIRDVLPFFGSDCCGRHVCDGCGWASSGNDLYREVGELESIGCSH